MFEYEPGARVTNAKMPFNWQLLTDRLAVVGWCFIISQSQPSFLLKAFSEKPFSVSNAAPKPLAERNEN